MHDVIPTSTHSDRLTLAASLAVFALAGAGNTTVDASAQSVVAAALAASGVYGVALYARTVSRKRLAIQSLGLWTAFLVTVPAHVAGAASAPGAIATIVHALTWTTVLGAATTTAFLGFREYGARTGAESPEERALEGGLDL